MACRIGISKNPQERIDYWKKQEGHTHGGVLVKYLTYNEAQTRETKEATSRGCRSAPGGDPGSDRNKRVWSVYHVWGGR